MEFVNYVNVFTGIGMLLAIGIFAILLFFLAFYIYFSLAWMTIAKKLKHKHPWLAWVPFANISLILQLGGFNWALIFLILIPFFGWLALFVIVIISTWQILEKLKYPGWFSLSMIIPQVGTILYLVVIGFAAWEHKEKPKIN